MAVRSSLGGRLGHLALGLPVSVVVAELVLGFVEDCCDEVKDAVDITSEKRLQRAIKQSSGRETYVLMIAVMKVPHGRLQFAFFVTR